MLNTITKIGKKLKSNKTVKPGLFGLFMTIPALITLTALIIFPLGYLLYNTLFKVNRFTPDIPPKFVGLENYISIFNDRYMLTAIGNTFFFVFVSVVIELIVGMAIAMLIYQPFKGRTLIRTLLLTPVMIAPVVAALQWRWLYTDQYGVINYILSWVGIDGPLWLADPKIAMWSIIIVDIWITFPFVMLLLEAGLASVSEELIEASKVDGANFWQRFLYIIFPIISPTILVVFLIRVMDAYRIFDTIYVLTRGGPGVVTETVSTYAYRLAFTNLNFESSGALSIMATLVVALFSVIMVRIMRKQEIL
ncbi:MAG: sugar ABC transporter permease [Anaerolineaceae bacterium]|nr:sugar ABC transporter permease [Anaerolineaceae bacterium]